MPAAPPVPDLSRLSVENLNGLLRMYPAGSPTAIAIQREIDGRLGRARVGKQPGNYSEVIPRKFTVATEFNSRPAGWCEKDEQNEVRKLLQAVGAAIYDTSQPFQAAITPGVPDLIAFVPHRGLVFVEVKAPGGKPTQAQVEFRERCIDAAVNHVLGGVEAVRAFLEGG